jgi:hypothetical protein
MRTGKQEDLTNSKICQTLYPRIPAYFSGLAKGITGWSPCLQAGWLHFIAG